MAFDPIAFKKTKHIARAAEFLRDLVAKEVVTLEHVSGTVMLADLLTKAVSRAIFFTLVRLLADTTPIVALRQMARCSSLPGDRAKRGYYRVYYSIALYDFLCCLVF